MAGSRELAVAAILALRDSSEVSAEGYDALRHTIYSYLQGKYSGGQADIDETVDLTIERLLANPDRLRGTTEQNAVGYVLRSARNAQIDRWRRARRETAMAQIPELPDATALEDAAVLALLDRAAGLSSVRVLLSRLRESGDHVGFNVIVAWLDVAAEQNKAPTTRQVADRVGFDHTTVSRVLARVRDAMSDVLNEDDL